MTNRNVYRGTLIVVLVILAGFQPSHAQYQEIEQLRQAAEDGHATAQYELAGDYDLGLMVPEDHAEAVKWYRLAAEQGHVEAQGRLGLKYGLGEGVKKDDWEAVKWYRKAAEQGHELSQYLLGSACYEGVGVLRNYQEAVKWYRLAAEQGHVDAQYALGWMYGKGKGVPENYQEAVKWYRLAAEQGHAWAQRNLGATLAMECLLRKPRREQVLREAAEALIRNRRLRMPVWDCNLVEAYAWVLLAGAQGTENHDKAKEVFLQEMTGEQITQAQELAAELFKRIEAAKSE